MYFDNLTKNSTFEIEYGKAVSAIGIFLWITLSNIVAIILLLWALKQNKKMTIPKILTLTLSIIDLIFGAFCVSMQTVTYWVGYEAAGGYPVCVYRGFSMVFTMLASQLTVVLMAVERLSSIRFPFQYHKIFTPKSTILIVVFLVIYAAFVALLPVFGVNHYGYGTWCDFHFNDKSSEGQAYVDFFIFEGFLCMAIIIICNSTTIVELCRMGRRVKPDVIPKEDRSRAQDERKFIFLMIGICVVYIVCTTPYLVRLMCNQLGMWPSLDLDHAAVRMNLGNNMANAHLFFLSQIMFSRRCNRCHKIVHGTTGDTQRPTTISAITEEPSSTTANTPKMDNDSFV